MRCKLGTRAPTVKPLIFNAIHALGTRSWSSEVPSVGNNQGPGTEDIGVWGGTLKVELAGCLDHYISPLQGPPPAKPG